MKNNFLISQPKHMLKLIGKKIFTILRSFFFISKPMTLMFFFVPMVSFAMKLLVS